MEIKYINLKELKTLVRSNRVKKVVVYASALQHYINIPKTEIYALTEDNSKFLFIDGDE